MPIDFAEYGEIVDRVRADISKNLPDVDPTIFGSFLRALADANAGRAYDVNRLQEQLLAQMFPQTSSGEFLELWSGYETLTRNAATSGSGPVTMTGAPATIIPAGTQLTSLDSRIYTVDTSVSLAVQTVNASTLTRSGDTATFICTVDHGLATGVSVIVSGADQADYNGLFELTITGTDTFTYEVSNTPVTPATGTLISATFQGGEVVATAQDAGQDTNLESGAQLSLVTPIVGAGNDAYVQFDGAQGGTDTETDSELLTRTLLSRANPVANFNIAAIDKAARAVSGVTRTKIKRITPDIGDVTILFVRDNDTNIIPASSEVATVKAAIVDLLPATSSENDVYVTAPTAVTTDYIFTALSPDSVTMRQAIEDNLAAFYRDEADFETDITEDKYRAAIINTIDPETGDTLDSFTISAPSGDITISTDEIGVLGTVTI